MSIIISLVGVTDTISSSVMASTRLYSPGRESYFGVRFN